MSSGKAGSQLEWSFGLINSAGKYLTAETFQNKIVCVSPRPHGSAPFGPSIFLFGALTSFNGRLVPRCRAYTDHPHPTPPHPPRSTPPPCVPL